MAAKKKAPTKKKSKKKKSGRQKLSPWQTIAIFADSGVGKTSVAATAPQPMFLDSNFGMLSIEGMPGFEHVRRTPVAGMQHLDRAYDNFTGTGRKDWRKFKTIVFDHFDDIQGLVKDELTELAVEKDPRRIADETQQREWGILGNRLRRYLRKVKSMPMHKILIFATGTDRETGKMIPYLQGSLSQQLPYFCDHIAYMRIDKEGRRIMYLEGTDQYLAKTRAWWLDKKKFIVPPPEEDPKFLTNLFELIAAGPKPGQTRSGKKRKKKSNG